MKPKSFLWTNVDGLKIEASETSCGQLLFYVMDGMLWCSWSREGEMDHGFLDGPKHLFDVKRVTSALNDSKEKSVTEVLSTFGFVFLPLDFEIW